MIGTRTLLLASTLALAGCSLAPEYQRPAMPIPQQFSLSQNALVPAPQGYQDTGWRTFFVDANLLRSKPIISQFKTNNLAIFF